MPHGDEPSKGDQYGHSDGTREVVFATEDGHILTVREYPDVTAFENGVAEAEYAGSHEGVLDLPDPEAFDRVDLEE